MKPVETLLLPFTGYVQLGMYEAAYEELESMPPEVQTHPMVLEARLILLFQFKRWEQGAILGESLCKIWPHVLGFHFKTAHCLHLLNRTEEAKDLLLAAPRSIRETALYFYTLSCYETKLGHHDEARDLLKTCFKIDPKFREKALDDVDLEPLWMCIIV